MPHSQTRPNVQWIQPQWSRMGSSLACFCLSSLFILFQLLGWIPSASAQSLPPICGTPGSDPPTVLSGVVNTYYPGTSSTASVGSTSITLGSSLGASTPINPGDLLLVIQMQDASINSSDSASYGGNNGTGSGFTSLNSAGSYQYVVATNSVPVGGGVVTLAQPLSFTFTNANATSTDGQKRYQVIRVPQYPSATISSTVTAFGWNGSVGGVVAFDVAGSLTFSGAGAINVNGQGFRGGGGTNIAGDISGIANNTNYVNLAPPVSGIGVNPAPRGANHYGGSKGEGVAGSPRYTRNGGFPPVTTVTDNGTEGYPNGSFSRGAPANAGGGGTDPNRDANAANTGGGGGANAGAGGQGGDSWTDNSATPSRQPVGGKGGTAISPSVSLVFLGGGGGAGTSNNSTSGNVPSGGGGGGMVFVRSGQLLGSGSISANGIQGVQPNSTDGGGGGGAGGTVLLQSVNPSTASITISANGGNGLNSGYNQHGPGGGGGGGYIAYQGFTPTTSVSGGQPGLDQPGPPPTNPLPQSNYGAVAGSLGLVQSTTIPPAQVNPGASCLPVMTVTKTTSTPTVTKPPSGSTTATYTIITTNASTSGNATAVSVSDLLPANFTYASTTSITLSGGATRPTTTNPTVGDSNPSWGSFTIPPNGAVEITFVATISAAAPLQTYQNPATVTYSDPTRTTPGATTTATYDSSSSTGEDVALVAGAPNLLLVKRITAINGVSVPVNPPFFQDLTTGPRASDDNHPNWPTNFLIGALDGGEVRPGDIVDFTVYFLSTGPGNATNVNICDLVPPGMTVTANAYTGQIPVDGGGILGADLGIALALGSTTPTTYMTSVGDGDRGRYFEPGLTPIPDICTEANTNGAIMVNLVTSPATLPAATGPGTPPGSYGFIRFRASVN